MEEESIPFTCVGVVSTQEEAIEITNISKIALVSIRMGEIGKKARADNHIPSLIDAIIGKE